MQGAAELKGKVCVITGGSKGMGRAFATALAAAGARVAIVARPSPELEAAARELGAGAAAFACDIQEPRQVDESLAEISRTFGRIDVVVNNAAITSLIKVETASPAAIQKEIAINLLGPILVTRAAIPYLRAAGGGDLVFVSSESVRMPYPHLSIYAAAKGGVEVFAAGMRNELRGQGTRVTVLRSGVVSDTSIESSWDPSAREAFFKACAETANLAFAAKPASKASMADALLSLLALPSDVNVDMIEVRGR